MLLRAKGSCTPDDLGSTFLQMPQGLCPKFYATPHSRHPNKVILASRRSARHARGLCIDKHVEAVAVICKVSALGHVKLSFPSARGLLLSSHNHHTLEVCKKYYQSANQNFIQITFYREANQQDSTSMRGVLDDFFYIYNHSNGVSGDTKIGYQSPNVDVLEDLCP